MIHSSRMAVPVLKRTRKNRSCAASVVAASCGSHYTKVTPNGTSNKGVCPFLYSAPLFGCQAIEVTIGTHLSQFSSALYFQARQESIRKDLLFRLPTEKGSPSRENVDPYPDKDCCYNKSKEIVLFRNVWSTCFVFLSRMKKGLLPLSR